MEKEVAVDIKGRGEYKKKMPLEQGVFSMHLQTSQNKAFAFIGCKVEMSKHR